jgi:hypothetical protein
MGGRFMHNSGASRGEGERASGFFVVASEAKQSIFCCAMDCFAALAMTVSEPLVSWLFEN